MPKAAEGVEEARAVVPAVRQAVLLQAERVVAGLLRAPPQALLRVVGRRQASGLVPQGQLGRPRAASGTQAVARPVAIVESAVDVLMVQAAVVTTLVALRATSEGAGAAEPTHRPVLVKVEECLAGGPPQP
jgi:hypothetical protein